MRAFQVLGFDQAPQLVEVNTPLPNVNQVRLKIEACGLNFADTLMIKGSYQDTPEPPFTLGLEVCGTIDAVGEGVDSSMLGQRVVVYSGSGGLADYGVFDADLCRPVPDEMPSTEAAGFMVAYGTSHLALKRRARLQPGETLLVTGAAGGVGLTAVELGKVMGARVIAVARGDDKLAVARDAGAHHLIDATDPDIIAKLKELGGIDVAYEAVGGDLFNAALKAANREARILAIGFASGDVPKVPANHLLVKNVDVMGFYWGGYMKFNPQALTDSLSELMDWYVNGDLKPHVSHVLPLDRAGEAISLLAERKSTGKVVVTP